MERLNFTQKGSVVRISMKNFMTYKDETIYPGHTLFYPSKNIISLDSRRREIINYHACQFQNLTRL